MTEEEMQLVKDTHAKLMLFLFIPAMLAMLVYLVIILIQML